MLRKYSEALNVRMSAEGVEAPSADVIEYALKIIVNTLSITLLALLVGLTTNRFPETIAAVLGLSTLRFVSGGYHIRSGILCIVVSVVLLSIIPHIAVPTMWIYFLNGISLLFVALLAPANFDKYAWASRQQYPILRLIGLIIVASNFIWMSSTLALIFALQAISLLFKEGGENI